MIRRGGMDALLPTTSRWCRIRRAGVAERVGPTVHRRVLAHCEDPLHPGPAPTEAPVRSWRAGGRRHRSNWSDQGTARCIGGFRLSWWVALAIPQREE